MFYLDLKHFSEIFGVGEIIQIYEKVIRKVNVSNVKDKGYYIFNLKLQLEELYYKKDPGFAKSISHSFFPVRNWNVSGPFKKYGRGDFNFSFGLEKGLKDIKTIKIKEKSSSGNIRLKCANSTIHTSFQII